jgi:hypothetical protein
MPEAAMMIAPCLTRLSAIDSSTLSVKRTRMP